MAAVRLAVIGAVAIALGVDLIQRPAVKAAPRIAPTVMRGLGVAAVLVGVGTLVGAVVLAVN